jgi:hypothetical protein
LKSPCNNHVNSYQVSSSFDPTLIFVFSGGLDEEEAQAGRLEAIECASIARDKPACALFKGPFTVEIFAPISSAIFFF